MRNSATKFTKHQHYSSYVFSRALVCFSAAPALDASGAGEKGLPRRPRGEAKARARERRRPRRGTRQGDMAPDSHRATAPSPGADPLDEFRRALGAGATSFLSPSEERAAAARDAARALFSRLSTSVAAEGVDLPFPELHTEGLDVEQGWMQIEMQLEPLLGKAKTALKRLRPAMQEGDAIAPTACSSSPSLPPARTTTRRPSGSPSARVSSTTSPLTTRTRTRTTRRRSRRRTATRAAAARARATSPPSSSRTPACST